jgi:hypothetical protein
VTPYDVSVTTRGKRLVLVFGSATTNVGDGALVVEGRRAGSEAVMRTWQVIRDLGPLLRYERVVTHEHWHLHAFARYELRSPTRARLVLRAQKAGFCLGDRYDADASRRLRNEPAHPRWTHDCSLGRVGAVRMHEGISVGYGDDYAAGLEGQYVDVSGLRAGRYLLVHRANPRGLIREVDRGNNASSVLVRLFRPAGGRPSVRVLARCPDNVRCPAP